MMEIRSYRRVFDLERRVYSVDTLRLNPGGVPVRGIVYFLVVVVLDLMVERLPLLGALMAGVPWFLRYLALPGASATLLSVLRLEGRTFHLSALSLLRFWVRPRRLAGLRECTAHGARWHPQEILLLPDGSDHRLRHMRYTGPGAVRVAVEHKRTRARMRAALTLTQQPHDGPLERSQVIVLEAGARLTVRSAASGGSPE